MSTFFRRDDWVTDAMGNAISGASVYVCSQPASTGSIPPSPLVQLYADPLGADPITQPVLTDGYGHAAYYLASGTYTVVYFSPQIQEVVLPDQLIGGAGVTFPVTVAEGGTNATTAAQALINLGGAASGANADITSLAAITGTIAIAGSGEISLNGGTTTITDSNAGFGTNLQALVIEAVGGLVSDSIRNATNAGPITVEEAGGSNVSMLFVGDGAATSGKGLIGFKTYPIQSTVGAAGSASALPANPSFYLQVSLDANNPLSLPAGLYVCPFYKQS